MEGADSTYFLLCFLLLWEGPQHLQFTLGRSIKSIAVMEEGTIAKTSEPLGNGLSLVHVLQPQPLC